MAKKTHKLEYLPDYDFLILGITSDEKDYKLIWDINNTLGLSLERKENYRCYHQKNKTELEFPLFSYADEASYITYKLISNKHEGFSLLEELKNLDYLFMIYDETGSDVRSEISNKLKRISSIRAVFNIDIAHLKNKDRLVFH